MMQRPRALLRAIGGAAAAAALVLPALSTPVAARVDGCGDTTLEATIVVRDDGRLGCGPGEPTLVRDDLATPQATRAQTRSAVASFIAMANLDLTDEESPFRAEFLDACNTAPDTVFRPHEALIPALVNAHVRAATALASDPSGSPLLHKSYDFAVDLGSATANRQRNELRWAIELLDGGGLLNPDTGADGYEGTQGADPRGAGSLRSPVPGWSLRELANERFVVNGLRAGPAPLPWLSVIGESDVRALGLPATEATGALQDAWGTGSLKLGTIGQQHLRRACTDPSVLGDPAFWNDVASDPGATTVVTADPQRRALDRGSWIAEHQATTGAPIGHGFTRTPCTDADGRVLARGCYTWDQGAVRFISLDTTPATGDGANIDPQQFAWLERQLRATTSRYFGSDGRQRTTSNRDRIVVLMQHHGTHQLNAGAAGDAVGGDELESLLLRYPNVVLQLTAAGRNDVRVHRGSDGTGYYEVSTASIADWPSQSRSIEIADNRDGTLSIFSVMVDAAAAADPRDLDWAGDDPTDERGAGAQRRINETWLASAAREIAANDPAASTAALGGKRDRNVELVIRNPLGVTSGTGMPLPDLPNVGVPPSFTPGLPGLPSFSPGFPPTGGGFPFQQPIPTPSFEQPPLTGPGLAVFPSATGGWGNRALKFLVPAGLLATWLVRARVRRWMVGI